MIKINDLNNGFSVVELLIVFAVLIVIAYLVILSLVVTLTKSQNRPAFRAIIFVIKCRLTGK